MIFKPGYGIFVVGLLLFLWGFSQLGYALTHHTTDSSVPRVTSQSSDDRLRSLEQRVCRLEQQLRGADITQEFTVCR